jgi:hypothetical protein
VHKALAIDFGVVGGVFVDKIREPADEQAFEDCGREGPAGVPVSLAIAGETKLTEKTGEQGRARFALSDGVFARFTQPTRLTIELPNTAPITTTLSRADR